MGEVEGAVGENVGLIKINYGNNTFMVQKFSSF